MHTGKRPVSYRGGLTKWPPSPAAGTGQQAVSLGLNPLCLGRSHKCFSCLPRAVTSDVTHWSNSTARGRLAFLGIPTSHLCRPAASPKPEFPLTAKLRSRFEITLAAWAVRS